MAMISVIIVNYNGRRFLGELLESLAGQTRSADEVILVDNASADGSVPYVRKSYPWVQVVRLDTNVGFAEGNNVGMDHAQGDYIVLLNSDTVVDQRCIGELEQALEADERVGAVVPKIYVADAFPMIDCAGAEFDNLGFSWGRGSKQPDRGQFNTLASVPAVTACAMILRRQLLGEETLFDRHLFMYYEELDLSLRIRGAGYDIVYAPDAIVHHKGSLSVGKAERKPLLSKQFYANRNRVKILSRYYPWAVLFKSLPLICLSLAYWDAVFLLKGGPILFLRAVAGQTRYALQGLAKRLRGHSARAKSWLPWMRHHGLGDLWALKSEFYGGTS